MMLGPPAVWTCPRCDATVWLPRLLSGNTFGAVWYSDLKCDATMLPEFPSFSKCPKCGEFFWIDDLKSKTKENGRFSLADFEMDEEAVESDTTRLNFLDVDDSFRFLEAKRGEMDDKREWDVRLKIAQLYNDRIRYDDRIRFGRKARAFAKKEAALWESDADKARWQKNLERLFELTRTVNPDATTFRAEIARELGRFDEAVAILDEAEKSSPPKEGGEDYVATKIRKKCAKSDPFVFCC